MQRMVNQFGTAQDSPELKQQLHQIRTYTQQLVKDTDNLLKDLVNCKDRHLKIQRDRLVDEFTSALTSFQTVQRKTVDFEKNSIKIARANSVSLPKPPNTETTKNYYRITNNSDSMFEDTFVDTQGPTQTQMMEDADLQALEEQERAIRELEENIMDVNDIYKKLGAMVYEQGAVVDSIESSVENTSVFVGRGTQNLHKASQYQNKLRRKKLLIAVILAIIVAVIILIAIYS